MPIKSIWGEDERSVIESLERIDQESERTTRDLKARWEKALRIFRQGDVERQQSLFRVNLVNANVRRGAAMLTESKPEIEITPRKDGLGRTARLLTRIINAIWQECQVQMVLEDMVTLAKIMQSSFASVTWDPSGHYGLGGIRVQALDPRLVGVDPFVRSARDISEAQYVWVDTVVPLYIAQANFPRFAQDIRPSVLTEDTTAMQSASRRSPIGRVVDRVMYGGASVDNAQSLPRVILRTYWLRDPATDNNGSPLYPNGRVVVKPRDQSLILDYDSAGRPGKPSPYYDGMPPIEWLDLSPDIDSPWGLEEIEAVRFLQAAYNRIGDALVETTLQNALQFIITDTNALAPEAVDFLRNAGFAVIERAVGRGVDKRPNELPAPVAIATLQFLHSLMDAISGLSDSTSVIGTRGRAELRSASMLEGLQSATQVLVRAQARRLESFLERLGQKLIARIFQFYTDDRVMTYITSAGELKTFRFQRAELIKELSELASEELKRLARPSEETQIVENEGLESAFLGGMATRIIDTPETKYELKAEHILRVIKGAWRQFRFQVKPLSSVSLVRMQRASQAIQLAQAQLIPTRIALHELGYENAEELAQEVAQEMQMRQSLGIQPSAPPPRARSRRS